MVYHQGDELDSEKIIESKNFALLANCIVVLDRIMEINRCFAIPESYNNYSKNSSETIMLHCEIYSTCIKVNFSFKFAW